MSEFAADPIRMMRRLRARFGEIAAIEDGGFRVVFLFSPELNQRVLSDSETFHSRFFAIRGSKRSAQRRLTEGLLSMNGQKHKRHRRMVKDPFSRRAISGYRDHIAQLATEMIAGWREGDVIDINKHTTQLMQRAVSGLIFGLDMTDLAYEIGEMTETWVDYNHRLGPLAFAPHPDLNDQYEQMLAFAEKLEAKVLELIQHRRESSQEHHDVLSLLLQAHDEQGGISDEELVGHVTLLFAAGHLTTAHTLTWTLFLLAQHPEVLAKLNRELHDHLGGRIPEIADIERLPYLARVIRESMRVLPASSYSQRVNTKSVELGPLTCAPGSIFIFSQFMTHHSADIYEAPDRFDPDRWLNISPSAYEYMPFGAGPRMCIGAALSMQILSITLPTLLQRFHLESIAGSRVDARVVSTMLNPMTPVLMRIRDAAASIHLQPVNGTIHDLVELRDVIDRRGVLAA